MHRVTRIITIASLVLGAALLLVIVIWGIRTRSALLDVLSSRDSAAAAQLQASIPTSRIGRGLYMATLHPQFTTAIAGAITAIVTAIVAAVFLLRRHRWPFLVTVAGCAGGIVFAWIGRGEVFDIEAASARSVKWAAKSPWVDAATQLAIAGTVAFSLLAVTAVIAWLTAPKTPKPAPVAATSASTPA